MTYAKYFEDNSFSFAKVKELYLAQKQRKNGYKSFDSFLNAEFPCSCKFKIGDIVVLSLNDETRMAGWDHNVVFAIKSICIKFYPDSLDEAYDVKFLTPHGNRCIGDTRYFSIDWLDRNCYKY